MAQSDSDNPSSGGSDQVPQNGQIQLQSNALTSLYQQMNNNPSFFLNPHAVAQAATAALAAAAQQVAQQQASSNHNAPGPGQSFMSNNNSDGNKNSMNTNAHIQQSNPNVTKASTSDGNSVASSLPSKSDIQSISSVTAPSSVPTTQAFSNNNHQQMVLNTQAQAAALLAAGVNPALLFNGNNNIQPAAPAPAMAAAQAFISLLQQQQQQNSKPTQVSIPNVQSNFKEQSSCAPKSPNPASILQHFNNSVANGSLSRGNHQIKRMESDTSSLSSIMKFNAAGAESHSNSKKDSQSSFSAAMQQGKANNMYASGNNNSIFYAQMQGWKLEQLGKFEIVFFHLISRVSLQ